MKKFESGEVVSESAFPYIYDEDKICYGGLTKREYFAAMAMTSAFEKVNPEYYFECASNAVKMADILIAALKADTADVHKGEEMSKTVKFEKPKQAILVADLIDLLKFYDDPNAEVYFYRGNTRLELSGVLDNSDFGNDNEAAIFEIGSSDGN